MIIKQLPLKAEEYYHDVIKKSVIGLHHTAGSHRPDNTINGWETDKDAAGNVLKVGTAFCVGGISTTDRDNSWDGVVVQAMPDELWLHHWGTKEANNKMLNQISIGIEICNYGPLKLGKDGIFYNYVNKPVAKDMVVKLAAPFRGYQYYHAYTPSQIAATKDLMLLMANKHNIDIRAGLPALLKKNKSALAFELSFNALAGNPGTWSHGNLRKDKFDISPQEAMIEMLINL